MCDCLNLLEEFYLDNVTTIKNNRSLYHIHKLINLRILSLECMECNTRFMSLICQTLNNLEIINLNDNNFMIGSDLLFLNMLCKLKSVSFEFIQKLSVHHLSSLRKNNVKLFPLKIKDQEEPAFVDLSIPLVVAINILFPLLLTLISVILDKLI